MTAEGYITRSAAKGLSDSFSEVTDTLGGLGGEGLSATTSPAQSFVDKMLVQKHTNANPIISTPQTDATPNVATAGMLTKSQMKAWKPQAAPQANKMSDGVVKTQENVNGQRGDAQKNIGQLAKQQKDLKAAEAPSNKAGSDAAGPTTGSVTRGLVADAAITAGLTASLGPLGPAAAGIYAGISGLKTGGHILSSLTGRGSHITMGNDTSAPIGKPSEGYNAQASFAGASEAGYSAAEQQAPVSQALMDNLSSGFGKTGLEDRADTASDYLKDLKLMRMHTDQAMLVAATDLNSSESVQSVLSERYEKGIGNKNFGASAEGLERGMNMEQVLSGQALPGQFA